MDDFAYEVHNTLITYKYTLNAATEVFGSNESVGTSHFVRYSRKSVTLDFFNAKIQFEDCQNVRYSQKSVISKSGTSENLCIITVTTR